MEVIARVVAGVVAGVATQPLLGLQVHAGFLVEHLEIPRH